MRRCLVSGDGVKEAWKDRVAEFMVTACDMQGEETNTGGDRIEVNVNCHPSTAHCRDMRCVTLGAGPIVVWSPDS